MRSYFSVSTATPQLTDLCDCSLDTEFLIKIVGNFKKILQYMPSGVFPLTLTTNIEFKTDATISENIILDLSGTVVLIYTQMFKEPYPTTPFTELQRQRINAIWEGIGHPENIIAT
jgi:hypothetical protein